MHMTSLGVECTLAVSEELGTELERVTGHEPVSATKNSLDGSPESVLHVVQTVASLVSAIAPLLALYINRGTVKKIKLDGLEIENPTKEQWERLWNDYVSRGASPPNHEQ